MSSIANSPPAAGLTRHKAAEKGFPMSMPDLRTRAHLTTVFAALAVTRFIENRTGWPSRKLVRTAAEDPLRPDLGKALALIK